MSGADHDHEGDRLSAQHYWGRTPQALLRDPEVPANGKALYGVLSTYAQNDSATAWPGLGTLAGHMGLHERTVRRIIEDLVERGWIEVTQRGATKSNLYRLMTEPNVTPVSPDSASDRTPVSEWPDTGVKSDRTPVSAEGDKGKETKEPPSTTPARLPGVAADHPEEAATSKARPLRGVQAAVAAACEWSEGDLTPQARTQVVKAASALAQLTPPPSPEEVTGFSWWWWAPEWRDQPPRPTSVVKHFAEYRAAQRRRRPEPEPEPESVVRPGDPGWDAYVAAHPELFG